MKYDDLRICPSCGGRNKAKWEFCARCGESLQGVPVGPGTAAAARVETEPDISEPFPWRSLVGMAVAIAACIAVFRIKPGPPPDPAVFARPNSAPPAASRPIVLTAAEKAFEDGSNLLATGHATEAVPLLAQAVEGDSSNGLYRYAYANALFAAGDKAAALGAYQAAASLDPQNAVYRADLGHALADSGQTAAAIAAYEEARVLAPDNVSIMRSLGQLYTSSGDTEKGTALLRRASGQDPGDPRLMTALGESLAKSGDLAGAIDTFSKVLERHPEFAANRAQMADALFRDGRKDDAIALVRAGVERDPRVATLHRDLGSLLERSGQLAAAAAEYKEYSRLAPLAADAKDLEARAAALEAHTQRASS